VVQTDIGLAMPLSCSFTCQSTIIIIRSSLIQIQAALSLANCLLEDNLVTDICVLLSGLMHCLLHTSGFSALDQFYIYISSAPDP